jgi:hypothetical protein
MSKLLKELVDDYAELVNDYSVTDSSAALLVLAEAIHCLGSHTFQPAMHEFGHELALSLKNVLKESILRTESDITGNLGVVNQ